MFARAVTLGAVLLMCSVAAGPTASACGACSGASGFGGALTGNDERWSVALASLGRVQIGSWDEAGHRRSRNPSNVGAYDATLQLALAVRPIRPFELAVMGGAGIAYLDAPGLATVSSSPTDLTMRARFDLLMEDPSRPTRPASAVWITARAPTGNISDPLGASTAGAIGSFGLGTWELAFGADVRRTFADRYQPFLALEEAARLPDTSLGFLRRLGPRTTARIGLNVFVSDWITLSALAEWNWEPDVELHDQQVPDSSEERTSVLVAASLRGPGWFRGSLSAGMDVPIDTLGRNADATFRVGVTVGYAGTVPSWQACAMRGPQGAPCDGGGCGMAR